MSYSESTSRSGETHISYICDGCGISLLSLPQRWIVAKNGKLHFCCKKCQIDYDCGNDYLSKKKKMDKILKESSGGCFITTATCQSRSLPDDCHELTSLRTFRDAFMKKNEQMCKEVAEYYEIAPKICKKIDSLADSAAVYEQIWQHHIKPAVDAVDSGENERAHEIYKRMVLELKSKYLG